MKAMKINKLAALSFAGLVIWAHSANAITPLSAKELTTRCAVLPETEDVDAQFCIRYIQGFVDGAVAAVQKVMLDVEAKLSQKEFFLNRVYRPCGITTELCSHEQIGDNILARPVVYGALHKNYPCKNAEYPPNAY